MRMAIGSVSDPVDPWKIIYGSGALAISLVAIQIPDKHTSIKFL